MGVLSGLEPNRVFHWFEEICRIPHGSGSTKAISDYLVRFARDRGLDVRQDELNNVIIRKPASSGYEAAPAVMLQGHMAMVCEKAPRVWIWSWIAIRYMPKALLSAVTTELPLL